MTAARTTAFMTGCVASIGNRSGSEIHAAKYRLCDTLKINDKLWDASATETSPSSATSPERDGTKRNTGDRRTGLSAITKRSVCSISSGGPHSERSNAPVRIHRGVSALVRFQLLPLRRLRDIAALPEAPANGEFRYRPELLRHERVTPILPFATYLPISSASSLPCAAWATSLTSSFVGKNPRSCN